MGKKSASFDERGTILAFYDSDDSPAPPGILTVDLTDDEWADAVESQGHRVVGGKLKPPVHLTKNHIAWSIYQDGARSALSRTDDMMLRIAEALALGELQPGTESVRNFITYRRDLRRILAAAAPAKIPDDLPALPPYPAGI